MDLDSVTDENEKTKAQQIVTEDFIQNVQKVLK